MLFEASSIASIDIDSAYSRLRSEQVQQLIGLIVRSKTLTEIYLDGNYLLDVDYMAILESLVASNKMSVVSLGEHTYISKETAAVSVQGKGNPIGKFNLYVLILLGRRSITREISRLEDNIQRNSPKYSS